ncbi:MAG: TIGR02147 family protein [Chitinivibrionales bacterium]|nr:TIGR02147 family protein [Chitinivibrionales bacterium]
MSGVFEYFDYRQFLMDILAEKQKTASRLSSRALAGKAGIDPSLFSKVLKGKRNISPEQVLRLSEVLELDKKSTEYFELLVRFCQARSHEAKRLYFDKLLEQKKYPEAAPLSQEQYTFYSVWYHTVIRELLHFFPRPHDTGAIAKMLVPGIKPSEAKQAIDLLEKLGIIKTTSDGGFELADVFITAGTDIQKQAIRNFQISMMDIAKDALVRFPKEKREISTLTLSLSEGGFKEVAEAIQHFRRKLMEIANNDSNISGVYQINFQAFPVTHVCREDIDNAG